MLIDGWILPAAIAASATLAANVPLIVACHRHGIRNRADFPLRLLLGQTPSQFLFLGLLFPVAALAAAWAAVKFVQVDFPTYTFEIAIIENFWIILIIGVPISMFVVYSDVLETTPDFFLLNKTMAEKAAVAAECIYEAIDKKEISGILEDIHKINFLKTFKSTGPTPADVLGSAIVCAGQEASKEGAKAKEATGAGRKTRLDQWLEEFDQRDPELHKSILFLQSLFTYLLIGQSNGKHIQLKINGKRIELIDPAMRLADKLELAVVVFCIWNYVILFGLLGLIKSRSDDNATVLPAETSLFVISATLLFCYIPFRYYTQKGMAFLSGNRAKEFGGVVFATLLGLIMIGVVIAWMDPTVGTEVFKGLPIIVAVMGLLLTHFRFSIARNIIGSGLSIRRLGMLSIFCCVVLFFTGTAWLG